MRMPLSLCRAQENVLAAWWGEHFSAQSSHEFEVLSQPHQRKTALCFARARHAGGAPWSTRWCFMAMTWHHCAFSSGREVQGKEALEDAECHWAILGWFHANQKWCISISIKCWWWKLHKFTGFTVFLSRSPTHIPATRRPVLKLQNDDQRWQESTRVCRNARVCEDLLPILIVLRVF